MGKNGRNTVARTMHDVGLAAWFGGSLMGAVGVNAAAGDVSDPTERASVASSAWGRWTPVNAAAIGAHLLGAVALTRANRGRITAQKGVAGTSIVKTGLTAAALGATAYSRVLGQKVMNADGAPVSSGAVPSAATPPEVAKAQSQLRALQWAVPGLTGALVGVSALAGEQQRPSQVLSGVVRALPGRAKKSGSAAARSGKAAALTAASAAMAKADELRAS